MVTIAMPPIFEIECQILQLAGTAVSNPERGCPMEIVFLRRLIPHFPDVELVHAMKRLLNRGLLNLSSVGRHHPE